VSARRLCACGCGDAIVHRAPQADCLNDTHRKRASRRRESTATETASIVEPDPRVYCGCRGDGDDPANVRRRLANLNSDPVRTRDFLDEPGCRN
jgi:hypothetical protein